MNQKVTQNCYIWGAGLQGKYFFLEHESELNFIGFIDSAPEKEGESYCGLPVFQPTVLNKTTDVVFVSPKNQTGIIKALESAQFQINKNFFSVDDVNAYYKIYAEQEDETVKIVPWNAEENPVVMVFSCDENYAPYAGLAIESIKKQRGSNRIYYFYIFNTRLTEESKNMLETLSDDITRVSCINLRAKICSIEAYFQSVNHISEEAYYRLLIPEIFAHYPKILYLDCDLICKKDIEFLFDRQEAEGKIVAVTPSPVVKAQFPFFERLGVPVAYRFNSGVMLFFPAACNRNKLKESCFQFLKEFSDSAKTEARLYADEAILNVACKNACDFLDYRWNVVYPSRISAEKEIYPPEQWAALQASYDDPYIIHYVTAFKPWNYLTVDKADEFWKMAKESIFYELIFSRLVERRVKNLLERGGNVSRRKVVHDLSRDIEECIEKDYKL